MQIAVDNATELRQGIPGWFQCAGCGLVADLSDASADVILALMLTHEPFCPGRPAVGWSRRWPFAVYTLGMAALTAGVWFDVPVVTVLGACACVVAAMQEGRMREREDRRP